MTCFASARSLARDWMGQSGTEWDSRPPALSKPRHQLAGRRAAAEAAAPAPESSKLWTPGSESSGSGGKLWTPGA